MSILKQIQEVLHRRNKEQLFALLALIVKKTGDGRSEGDTLYYTIMRGYHQIVDAAVRLMAAENNHQVAEVIADILMAAGDQRPKDNLIGFLEMATAKMDGRLLHATPEPVVSTEIPRHGAYVVTLPNNAGVIAGGS